MRGQWVLGFILIWPAASGCRSSHGPARAVATPDWWYEITIEKPVIEQNARQRVFKLSQGVRIYREPSAMVLAPGGLDVDPSTPPVRPASLQVGEFWMRRESGSAWEVSSDEPVRRRPSGKNLVEDSYGEVVSALGADAVGPFDIPEFKSDVQVGDSWPTSVIVGTRYNKRRIAMICTLRHHATDRRIEFRTADMSRQEGSWTIDAKGELVAYESEQNIVVSVVGTPERTGLVKVTVRKKTAPESTPPPTARQNL